MQKKLLYILLLANLCKADQVSVFGAGNLNSPNPYGLTNTEKNILKNKKELGSIDSKVKDVRSTVSSVNQRLDGLESIYEGDSAKLNKTVIKLNNLILDVEANKKDIADVKNVSNQILLMQEEISIENKKNLDALKLAIKKLTRLVNKINARYISEKEFKKNMSQFITVKEFNAFKRSLGKKTNTPIKAKSPIINDKNALMIEAKALFKRDRFTKAIPMFEKLISVNYKPAENNFYLGEIWYYRKKFDDAIRHFKISANLYDKASYMPKLLLHSAISFEKINDLDNAGNFYSTLIDVYPESKEAKQAYKNLSSIN